MVNAGGRPREHATPVVHVHLYVKDSTSQGFRDLASRENQSLSDFFEAVMDDYIQRHGAGNDSYKLTEFDNGLVKAYPTAWKKWTPEELPKENYSESELEEMRSLLRHNLAIIDSLLPQDSPKDARIKFSEEDILWLMSSRNWTREQALIHLSGQGCQCLDHDPKRLEQLEEQRKAEDRSKALQLKKRGVFIYRQGK